MKLLHNCVRDVLLDIENNLELRRVLSTTEIHSRNLKYSHNDIYYTCQKLKEADYIEVVFNITGTANIESMTYQGHLFLDTIRDDTIWKKTISKISKYASVSLPILQQVASQILALELRLPQ